MKSFIIAAAILSLAIPAFAGTLNLSTGYNSGGTLICPTGSTTCSGNDANWTVVENNAFNSGATGPGEVVNPADADFTGPTNGTCIFFLDCWVANGVATPPSDWIAYNATNANGNGLGTYSITFTLTSADVSTASLSGSWTLDDLGELVLNGNVISILADGNWSSMMGFSTVSAGSPDFVIGTNTLQAIITASDVYLEGVNVSATLTGYTAATPEPSTLLLVALGLALVLCRLRRKFAH